MLWIVRFEDIYTDQPERLADRARLMPAHLSFLESQGDRVVASGALRETEDGVPQGGLWILNVPNRAAAEAIYHQDPFWLAGLRKSVSVSVWARAHWSPAFADCVQSFTVAPGAD